MGKENPDFLPPGWDYNPSSLGQRVPIVAVAVIGVAVATYLTLFQLKIIPSVWEPFFGDGSRKILTSKISHALVIPDAALGALGYLADAVTGIYGGRDRWRAMPWIVIVFGLAVGPLGFISILLVVSQPVFVGEWCTLCLSSAVISVVMIGPAMDEFLASLQFLKRACENGHDFWSVFWGIGDNGKRDREILGRMPA